MLDINRLYIHHPKESHLPRQVFGLEEPINSLPEFFHYLQEEFPLASVIMVSINGGKSNVN